MVSLKCSVDVWFVNPWISHQLVVSDIDFVITNRVSQNLLNWVSFTFIVFRFEINSILRLVLKVTTNKVLNLSQIISSSLKIKLVLQMKSFSRGLRNLFCLKTIRYPKEIESKKRRTMQKGLLFKNYFNLNVIKSNTRCKSNFRTKSELLDTRKASGHEVKWQRGLHRPYFFLLLKSKPLLHFTLLHEKKENL